MNKRIIGMLFIVFVGVDTLVFASQEMVNGENKNENREIKKEGRRNRSRERAEKAVVEPEAAPEEEVADPQKFVSEFDVNAREKSVRALLNRGVAFCANNDMPQICEAFTHTKDFIEGELYLFLIDTKGVVYAHGDQSDLLWKNLFDLRDMFGAFLVRSMIKTAQAAPGWVTYEWKGSVKVSFVQKIIIDGKEYVIGCGYFPHSKKYATISLVKGAVTLFNTDVAEGALPERAFSAMSYPLSEQFIFGDLYLYALDFEGNIRAQGERPGLIGSSALDYKDSTGRTVNQEIIAQLKEKKEGEGIWIDYMSKNALKTAYAEKVKDKQGKYYFIACGYYPEIDRDKTVNLVRRGYQFMKASGMSVTIREFTDSKINTYRVGDLALFIYDMKGMCIANGRNQELIGQNQFDAKDDDGRYYVREIIDQARNGGGWVDFKLNNSFQATYVQKVEMGVDEFVIGSGMFPVSKPDTMTLLVKSAVGYFNRNTIEHSFDQFASRKGKFVRGDLFIFVFDQKGFCYAWSDSYKLIWQNLLNWKDDNGKEFVKLMIESSAHGPDYSICRLNNDQRVNYFEQVEKDGIKYLIGSGFYK